MSKGAIIVNVDVDYQTINQVMRSMENLRGTKNVIRRAITNTAKKAIKMVAKETARNYVYGSVKKRMRADGFNKSMEILKRSTIGEEVIIYSKGSANEVLNFKTKVSDRGVSAKVLRSSSLNKLLRLKRGNVKAFVTTFKSKHEAVVQRVPVERADNRKSGRRSYITKHNQKIKTIYSPSVPGMLGGKHGYGRIEDDVGNVLQENIRKEWERLLEKK